MLTDHAVNGGRPTAVPVAGPARASVPVPLSRRIREVLLRGGGAGAAAVAVAVLHAVHDPGVICPLRRITGIPCPVCGSTTVFIELGSGHPVAALLANPFTVVFGLGLLFAPLGVEQWWRGYPKRLRTTVLAVAAVLSWGWQLHRFGFLPH